ncbi:MAG: hypothetical protein WCD35_01380, partial [Mycobacteriales bacterium]
AAEDWITRLGEGDPEELVNAITLLFATTPDRQTRLAMFPTSRAFSQRDDSFDVWLRAVQRRATEALAGIHSDPLVDPEAE